MQIPRRDASTVFFIIFFLLARRRCFCPLSLVHFGFVYTSALIMNRYIEHSRGLSRGWHEGTLAMPTVLYTNLFISIYFYSRKIGASIS